MCVGSGVELKVCLRTCWPASDSPESTMAASRCCCNVSFAPVSSSNELSVRNDRSDDSVVLQARSMLYCSDRVEHRKKVPASAETRARLPLSPNRDPWTTHARQAPSGEGRKICAHWPSSISVSCMRSHNVVAPHRSSVSSSGLRTICGGASGSPSLPFSPSAAASPFSDCVAFCTSEGDIAWLWWPVSPVAIGEEWPDWDMLAREQLSQST